MSLDGLVNDRSEMVERLYPDLESTLEEALQIATYRGWTGVSLVFFLRMPVCRIVSASLKQQPFRQYRLRGRLNSATVWRPNGSRLVRLGIESTPRFGRGANSGIGDNFAHPAITW